MNQARFGELAQAFGGALARWPAEARAASERWLEAHPEAEDVLARERGLDARLANYEVTAPLADVQRRIATRLLSERRLPRRVAAWLAASAALLGAGAVGAGATAGAAMVAVAPAPAHLGHVGAIYEQSSFGDFGSADEGGEDAAGT